MTLSQGEELSYRMSLAETSTEAPVFFCLHLLPLPLQGLSVMEEVMQVPCTLSFLPSLLVPLALAIPGTEQARGLKKKSL